VSFDHLLQRIDSINDRFDLSRLDQFFEKEQLLYPDVTGIGMGVLMNVKGRGKNKTSQSKT
jgi:hypothetical protein